MYGTLLMDSTLDSVRPVRSLSAEACVPCKGPRAAREPALSNCVARIPSPASLLQLGFVKTPERRPQSAML